MFIVMYSNLIVILLIQIVLIIKCSKCDFLFVDDTLQEGDECYFNETIKGICSGHCHDLRNFQISDKLCSINGETLLYCCIGGYIVKNTGNSNNKRRSNGLEVRNIDTRFYKDFDVCQYNEKIQGVCRSQCPDLKFPKYKLLLTDRKTCPVENGPSLECCINHLQIAYPAEIFQLNNTYKEGDFCPYDGKLIGICENFCAENYKRTTNADKFGRRNPICSHQSDGTPVYCCADYYSTNGYDHEVVPNAREYDGCIHQKSKSGLCKKTCNKLTKFQRSGVIPTMCPHNVNENPLYCCPILDETDELEKYRNASGGRISYRKCQEFKMERLNRVKRRIHSKHGGVSGGHAGGWDIKYGEYPHMAAIGWTNRNGNIDWNCGGSLISEDFVMTAAHCTLNEHRIPPDIIRIGDQYLDVLEDPVNLPQNFTIKTIIKHPEYSHFSSYNDIALIQLNQSVILTLIVHPACLWNDNDDIDDELLTISMGYGSTEFGGPNSRKLLQGNLKQYTHEECVNIYKNLITGYSFLKYGILDTQLCAGDPQGIQDTCQGDSGGPLEYRISNVHYIFGITSVGQNCPSSVPGIYTKVSKYLDWIEIVVWKPKWLKT